MAAIESAPASSPSDQAQSFAEISRRAVHWILGLPGVFLNTAGDLSLPPRVLEVASRFERCPSDDGMAAMLDSTRMTSLFGLAT